MTLAEFKAMDLAAVWAGIDPERQAAIGIAAIEQCIAGNMAEENAAVVTPQDRRTAEDIDLDATVELVNAIEAALPDTKFYTPSETVTA